MRRYFWILGLCCVVGIGGAPWAPYAHAQDVEEITEEGEAPPAEEPQAPPAEEPQAPQQQPPEGGGEPATATWPDVTYNQDVGNKSADNLLDMIKGLSGCPATVQAEADKRKNWLFHHAYTTTLGAKKTLHFTPKTSWARVFVAFRLGQEGKWTDVENILKVDEAKDKASPGWAAAETNNPNGSARHYLDLTKARATAGPPTGAPNAALTAQIVNLCDALLGAQNGVYTDQVAYAKVVVAYYAALVGDDHYYLCRDELDQLD